MTNSSSTPFVEAQKEFFAGRKRGNVCVSAFNLFIRAGWLNSHQLHCVLDALVSATPLRLVSSQGRRLLTKREDDVVKLVADGLSNRNVAHKLGLTEHTVSNYLFRIYEKLGISSRVELVLYALKQRQG